MSSRTIIGTIIFRHCRRHRRWSATAVVTGGRPLPLSPSPEVVRLCRRLCRRHCHCHCRRHLRGTATAVVTGGGPPLPPSPEVDRLCHCRRHRSHSNDRSRALSDLRRRFLKILGLRSDRGGQSSRLTQDLQYALVRIGSSSRSIIGKQLVGVHR